ncbi:hypothetical protein [Streptomyces broussonetiae]|uniref:hypothetical protein n=1 Tax=Streptomyces broussonetiae TaxID=2686304 RepID=UPI0035E172B3
MDEPITTSDAPDARVRVAAFPALACDRCTAGACAPEPDRVLEPALRHPASAPDPHVRGMAVELVGAFARTDARAVTALEAAHTQDLGPVGSAAPRSASRRSHAGGSVGQGTAVDGQQHAVNAGRPVAGEEDHGAGLACRSPARRTARARRPVVEAVEDKYEIVAAGQGVAIAVVHAHLLRPDLTAVPLEDIEPSHVVPATRTGDRNRLLATFCKAVEGHLGGGLGHDPAPLADV